jgi:hypothetical protein
MSDFFSLPGTSRAPSVSQKAFWFSQGVLLAAAVGGFTAIFNEIDKHKVQTAELVERFRLLEQQLAHLTEDVEAIRADLAKQTKPAVSRSVNARSQRSDATKSVSSSAKEETTGASAAKKSGTRKTRKATPTSSEDSPLAE